MIIARVFNAYGQLVKYVYPQSNDITTFSVADLRRAVYLVEIQTPKEIVIERLAIIK